MGRSDTITVKNAGRQPFVPLVKELARAYQAFAAYDAAGFADADLTVPQADVLFSLGNTDGLTCKEIGERTLITKGTLTGVLDRLEAKGLVRRIQCTEDGRATRLRLTKKGEKLFAREFPRQIAHLKRAFDGLSKRDMDDAVRALKKISDVL